MIVNADFSCRAMVTREQHQWTPSPQGGVERVMFDRTGAEQARATSLVRYAAGAHFPQHQHPGGEEILVLEGTFCEGAECHPAGTYLRNPPGSAHQPYSHDGALIFVKLRQMADSDDARLRIDTTDPAAWRQTGGRDICQLYAGAAENVSLQKVPAGVALFDPPPGGAELLVLAGAIVADGEDCAPGSWIRLPPGDMARLIAGRHGATFYLKTGHLRGLPAQDNP